jgi:hypothetical protein
MEIAVFGDGDELGWHFDNSKLSGLARVLPLVSAGWL